MRLEITCQDRLGITQDVLDILVEHKIDLRGIEIDRAGKIFLNFPNIEFADFQHLMPKIRRIEGITDVKTTAFMPVEREKHQLRAILQTLPDPVFSIDRKGTITQINDAVELGMPDPQHELLGAEISEVVKGFNFAKWLDGEQVLAQAHKLQFAEQDYLADILPIYISDSHDEKILAGAVVLLKSEVRLGEQLSAFNRPNTKNFDRFMAQSVAMQRTLANAQRLATLEQPLLILGEIGSGKKLLASAIHHACSLDESQMLFIKTAGKTADVIENEMFAHNGCLMSALNSVDTHAQTQPQATLIIDELTYLDIASQQRILRLIEQQQFTPLNSNDNVDIAVRVIACSNQDLERAAEQGAILPELLVRLSPFALAMPSLRERKADILPLAEHFIQQHCMTLGRKRVRLAKSASDYLVNYPWQGNVRQLEQILQRAVALTEQLEIKVEDLQLPTPTSHISFVDENFEGSLDQEVKRFEKQVLARLYPFYPSTRQLAKKLGLSHTAIANKLRDYGISKK
ncbi:sigma 54-interacting transcriptional regulator [Alteromonas flava]|uniref:sigma 54-interacting transcriptional regulator n=1 Tax=Alteromonas flava TaxID=2048003 RepID=UPI000C289F75|nr:sigma 54-interacting transcriptional regulator [Alteromonas flava]